MASLEVTVNRKEKHGLVACIEISLQLQLEEHDSLSGSISTVSRPPYLGSRRRFLLPPSDA
jgi:hypothetical protein